jgi:hypothetical protein
MDCIWIFAKLPRKREGLIDGLLDGRYLLAAFWAVEINPGWRFPPKSPPSKNLVMLPPKPLQFKHKWYNSKLQIRALQWNAFRVWKNLSQEEINVRSHGRCAMRRSV